MDSKKRNSHNMRAIIMMVTLLGLMSVLTYVMVQNRTSESSFLCDAKFRWLENAYVIRGVNPFDVISGKTQIDKTIGDVPTVAGTVPWAYVLGNIIIPGFLPYSVAVTWLFVVMALVWVSASLIVPKWLESNHYVSSFNQKITVSLLVAMPSAWGISIYYGNYGGIICGLIIISMCIIDIHPIGAGLILAVAMCKPQTAFVFFIPLLFMKKWKTIATSIIAVFSSWIAAAILIRESPIKMVSQILSQGLSYGLSSAHMYGLFDGLYLFGIPSKVIIIFDIALAFALFLVSGIYMFKTNTSDDMFAWYSIASVISIIWFYKQPQDFVVLALPTIYIVCSDFFKMYHIPFIVAAYEQLFLNVTLSSNIIMLVFLREIDMLFILQLLPFVLYIAKENKKTMPASIEATII